MADPSTTLAEVRTLLASGNGDDAYRALRSAFAAGPNPLEDTTVARDAIALLAELSRGFGAHELADELTECATHPEDPNLLYGAAYNLYEQGQFAAGGALLYRANALAPGQRAIVSELAGCLEKQLRYGEAALVIEGSGLAESDPLCAYLNGFCWLMVGQIEQARPRVAQLAGVQDGHIPYLRGALEAMLARADALTRAKISLDERALTAWQSVLSGSLLLHESPYGHDDPMHGRYAFVQDSASLEREALERLVALLTALDARPTHVLSAPDRMSKILGAVASRLLDAPCVEWSPEDTSPGLVVAWTMEAVEDSRFLQALHEHHPQQRLYVHGSCWTEPFAYSPDVTGLLHQNITAPWTGGALQFDPATRITTPAPADTRTEAEIAEAILAAPKSDSSASSLDAVRAIAVALAALPEPHAPGLFRTHGKRIHQRAGGPVTSNRFD
jgi:hypothetical protein